MSILADHYDVVIGVDTHKHTHTAVAIDAATAVQQQSWTVSAAPAGYADVLGSVSCLGSTRRCWAIEGCGSWGKGLARWLATHGEHVIEVERPKRPARHNGAKSDAIDALRAAREALASPHHAGPRCGARRDALAALVSARRSALAGATDAERQLLGFVTTAPESLSGKLRQRSTRPIVNECCSWRPAARVDADVAATAAAMKAVADRARALRGEAARHEELIRRDITLWRPDLLEIAGVGPITAAVALCAWSHHGRLRSESAFAMLAGTAPIPASSGQTNRHRLNRGGDRQLNWAIHMICVGRIARDRRTQAYLARRRAEGKTTKEIQRCLKRYIARELYRALESGLDTP